MEYTNNKIRKLISERDAVIDKYNREIRNELQLEKANYKFSWKRFLFMIAIVFFAMLAYSWNKKIFPKTSIWSWEYAYQFKY